MGHEVFVVGAAATPVGRLAPKRGTQAERLEHDILAPLVFDALAQAGLTPDQVDSAVFAAPTPATRQLGFSTYMASRLGLTCKGQVSEVSAMGLTGALAFDQAVADVALGRADVALALGVAFSTNADFATIMDHSVRAVGDLEFQAPFGLTPISWYAFDTSRYCYETGVTREDIAHIAVKSRLAAAHNPLAQFRDPLSLDQVLTQKQIVEPLGRFEVPAISDGAVCLVVANEKVAQRKSGAKVRISGRGYCHEGYHQIGQRPHDMIAFPSAYQATQSALKDAGVSLEDIDFSELYAPCTITEVLVSESIGLFEKGEGAYAAKRGASLPDGPTPINTSGGCLARGHPTAVTGLYGILELFEQLTGVAGGRQVASARYGLHACELGNYNAALVHVLEGGV